MPSLNGRSTRPSTAISQGPSPVAGAVVAADEQLVGRRQPRIERRGGRLEVQGPLGPDDHPMVGGLGRFFGQGAADPYEPTGDRRRASRLQKGATIERRGLAVATVATRGIHGIRKHDRSPIKVRTEAADAASKVCGDAQGPPRFGAVAACWTIETYHTAFRPPGRDVPILRPSPVI